MYLFLEVPSPVQEDDGYMQLEPRRHVSETETDREEAQIPTPPLHHQQSFKARYDEQPSPPPDQGPPSPLTDDVFFDQNLPEVTAEELVGFHV